MKYLLLLLLSFVFCNPVSAQWYGLLEYDSRNMQFTGDISGFDYSEEYEMESAFGFGLGYQKPLTEKWSLDFSLRYYLPRDYKEVEFDIAGEGITGTLINPSTTTFTQLDLAARYYFQSTFYGLVGIGYLIPNTETFGFAETAGPGFGLSLGVGAYLDRGRRLDVYGIISSYSLSASTTDQGKANGLSIDSATSTALSIGIRYNFTQRTPRNIQTSSAVEKEI